MPKKNAVPDAWEDDWEAQADKITKEPEQPAPGPAPSTKAERLARHVESNRKLWESADTQKDTFHFVEANNTVPLQTSFKPQVKVLSRKPVIAKRDPTTGMSQMTLEDDDDEGKGQDAQPTPEEIRARQKREREEKQRRYEEARAKIFGDSAPSSGQSSPGGTVTPPRDGQTTPRGRGRGRGGQQRGNNDSRRNDNRRQNNQAPPKELFDPNYASKPDPFGRRQEGDASPRISSPRNEEAPIRAPRGPDGSGRGGFGFARRGGKDA